jgi:purine-binding chemotaxis protein CheW
LPIRDAAVRDDLRSPTGRASTNTKKQFAPEARDATMEKELQLVGFRIGRETFGLPIASVREIVRVPEITSVPNAPEYIEGVINLRGRIIPVVDLRKRFGDKSGETSKKNRIVVVEMQNRAIGLLVHSASEVLRIPPSEIEAPQNVFQEGELSFITGVGKLNGRLVILLDLSRILERSELRRLEDFAEPTAPVPVGVGQRNT